MIYMLNLVFDASDTNESNNGRFQEYQSTQTGLQQSQVWFKQSNPSNPTPNPDLATDWTSPSDDNEGPLQAVLNDQIWVRIQGLNIAGATPFCARMTTIVARDARKASKGNNGKAIQQRGSPFVLSGQQSCVLYDYENPIYQAPSAAGSWVQKLGAVTFVSPVPTNPPIPPNFHDSYSMIVAATIGQGPPSNSDPTNVRTYAHDPEFDVEAGE
jgi:hypothetical protein